MKLEIQKLNYTYRLMFLRTKRGSHLNASRQCPLIALLLEVCVPISLLSYLVVFFSALLLFLERLQSSYHLFEVSAKNLLTYSHSTQKYHWEQKGKERKTKQNN